ncbi:MAG: hypothetical protein P4L35_14990, partial [Ignavibacteriaceae bacterium]|nr:hypothetical protein [Ignavibacteriaceae bacterium]
MGTDSNYYKEIIGKLENLTKREYTFIASLGVQSAVMAGVTVFTLFALLEMLFHFSSTVRTILILIFLVILIGGLGYLFLIPLLKYFNIFRKTDYFKTARKVGDNFPDVKDDLLNAMQLVSTYNLNSLYSNSLINAAFSQVYNKTRAIRFETIVSFKRARHLLLYFSGMIVVAFGLLGFVPGLN